MPRQRRHGRARVVPRRQRLHLKPLVEDQRIVAMPVVEDVERRLPQLRRPVRQHGQRAHPVGHVVRRLELGEGQLVRRPAGRRRQVSERDIPEPPSPLRLGRVGVRLARAVIRRRPPLGQPLAQRPAQPLARPEDRVGIDHAHLVADEAFGRQQHRLSPEGGVERRIVQRLRDRRDHRVMVRPVALDRVGDERVEHQLLHRLVPRERVVVVGAQEAEIGGGPVALDHHGGGEAAVDRQHRSLAHALEHDRLGGVGEQHQPLLGQRAARLRAEQLDLERQEHRLLARLPRRRRGRLRQPEPRAAVVVGQARLDARRPPLAVPPAELGEVDATRLLHAGDEILARRGRPVEPLEIQVRPRPELRRPQDRRRHADELGTLVVDGRRVEVRDFLIAVRAHGMGERPGVLGELTRAQAPHVLDPLHRRRSLVRGETLVAIDGETFLEAQLEPVAAGDAVARPVVEILVRHDGGDRVVVVIGRGVRIGQDVARVEHVETLVLHGAEVEIVHRDDVEHVQVVLAAVGLLVPRHRQLQGVKRVVGLGEVRRAHPDAELDRAPGPGDELAPVHPEVARHQREQVGRLGERVVPLRPVPPVIKHPLRDRIAVREQHGVTRRVGGHPHTVHRQHVRPVGERRDPPESLRLALRAQDAVRRVQPHQLRVLLRRDRDLDLDQMRLTGQRHDQPLAVDAPVVHQRPVDAYRERFLARAVKPERLRMRAAPLDREPAPHDRPRGVEVEIERHFGHQPLGRAVILAAGDGGQGEGVLHVHARRYRRPGRRRHPACAGGGAC